MLQFTVHDSCRWNNEYQQYIYRYLNHINPMFNLYINSMFFCMCKHSELQSDVHSDFYKCTRPKQTIILKVVIFVGLVMVIIYTQIAILKTRQNNQRQLSDKIQIPNRIQWIIKTILYQYKNLKIYVSYSRGEVRISLTGHIIFFVIIPHLHLYYKLIRLV